MKIITAPDDYNPNSLERSVFLAGGITDCPPWQNKMISLLNDCELTLLNPRRENFPIDDPDVHLEQIVWEFNTLKAVHVVLFWFPNETLCPICLYELGKLSARHKPIFVGVHPEYSRRQDVEIQTHLARPDVEIVYSLENLANQIKAL